MILAVGYVDFVDANFQCQCHVHKRCYKLQYLFLEFIQRLIFVILLVVICECNSKYYRYGHVLAKCQS